MPGARIIDIAKPKRPRVVSNMRLAVNNKPTDPGLLGDPGANFTLQGYAGHYCGVPSNADPGIPRNRIRHELIPFLEARFARNVVEVLDRQAAIARDDAQYLEETAAAAIQALVVRTAGGVEIPIRPLLAQPPAFAPRSS